MGSHDLARINRISFNRISFSAVLTKGQKIRRRVHAALWRTRCPWTVVRLHRCFSRPRCTHDEVGARPRARLRRSSSGIPGGE